MSTLRIYNYEILNFEMEPMVFSSTGFTKITEPKIIKALQELDNIQSKYIEYSDLEKILRKETLEPKSALDFLKSLLILSEEADPPHFQEVMIYHDLDIPPSLQKYYEKKHNNRIKLRKIGSFEKPNNNTPTLFIFVCLKLQPDSIRSIYTNLMKEHPNHGASIGFISSNHFHLTEVYVPSIGNPCAFCTFDRIAHYETKRASQHPWSKVWTFCCKNNFALPKSTIDDLQTTLIIGAIVSFTNKLTQAPKFKYTQDLILLSRTVDLETGIITEEASTHWPFCECLGN